MKLLNGLFEWWRNHSAISLVITGGALAAAIPKYVELVGRALTWMRNRRTKRVERYIPGANDWERVRNVRFGFAFSYPRAWIRKTSGSTDGHTITHPAIPEIEIRGWGSYSGVVEGSENWIQATLRDNGVRVIYSSEAHVQIRSRPERQPLVEATRAVFELGGSRIMQIFTEHDGIQVAVRGSAPAEHFDEFEAVFLTACHSLALLEPADRPGRLRK
jgi:hypothetical protein